MKADYESIAQDFANAGILLANQLADHVARISPELAEKIGDAVRHGSRLSLCLHLGEDKAIELTCADDYGRVRSIGTIPLHHVGVN